jgi:hypothetical protein
MAVATERVDYVLFDGGNLAEVLALPSDQGTLDDVYTADVFEGTLTLTPVADDSGWWLTTVATGWVVLVVRANTLLTLPADVFNKQYFPLA